MFKSRSTKSLINIFTYNFSYKVLALVISVLLAIFILGRDDVSESREMDIVVKLPDNYSLVSINPNVVNITLIGNPKILQRYFKQKKALVFEIYKTSAKNMTIEIKEEKLLLPFGLELVEINPKYFNIEMQTKDTSKDILQKNGGLND